MTGDPHLTWNLIEDIRQLFDYPFMVNAFRAGTIAAVPTSLIGWFMVLRRQTFAGHTLAVVSFPGASAAILLGISASAGFFAFAIAAALIFAVVAPGGVGDRREESALVGTVQAFALGCGFLFVTLSHGNLAGSQALLFGSFVAVSPADVEALLVAAVLALVVLISIGRPLFFASVDPDVAAARGVPVRALSVAFLLLLGIAAAEASQITGSLLVFALLVLPAAAAQSITSRPAAALVLTVAIALFVTWLGLALSYYNNRPIGFHVTSLAFAVYVVARIPRRMPGGLTLKKAAT